MRLKTEALIVAAGGAAVFAMGLSSPDSPLMGIGALAMIGGGAVWGFLHFVWEGGFGGRGRAPRLGAADQARYDRDRALAHARAQGEHLVNERTHAAKQQAQRAVAQARAKVAADAQSRWV